MSKTEAGKDSAESFAAVTLALPTMRGTSGKSSLISAGSSPQSAADKDPIGAIVAPTECGAPNPLHPITNGMPSSDRQFATKTTVGVFPVPPAVKLPMHKTLQLVRYAFFNPNLYPKR